MPSYPISGNEFIFDGTTLTVYDTIAHTETQFTIGNGLCIEVQLTSLSIENTTILGGFILHRTLHLNPSMFIAKPMEMGSTGTYISREDNLEFVGTEDLDYVDPGGEKPGTAHLFLRRHYRYMLGQAPLVLRQNGPDIEIYRRNLSNEINFLQYCETRRKALRSE